MWLLDAIISLLHSVYRAFLILADEARDIPLIGGWCADRFVEIAFFFYDIRAQVWEVGYWFEDVRSSLLDVLNWDTVYEKIRSIFFGGLTPWNWLQDNLWAFLDNYFPWLRDPETTVWDWVGLKVEELVKAITPTIDTITDWFWGFVDTNFPWLRDPKTSVTDWVWAFVDTYFPWLRDPETTVWDWVKERITDRFPVIKDLDLDPIGWLSGKMGDALGAFLGVAAWPFMHTVEGFLERLWDEESEEGA